MDYWVYDMYYVIESTLSIIIKSYLIIIAYRFINRRRWPKFNNRSTD